MARRDGNKSFNRRRNKKGPHQRRRTTRGHRLMSKLQLEDMEEDLRNWLFANLSSRR